jgi:hypothetical protein
MHQAGRKDKLLVNQIEIHADSNPLRA